MKVALTEHQAEVLERFILEHGQLADKFDHDVLDDIRDKLLRKAPQRDNDHGV